MAPFYQHVCETLGRPADQALLSKLQQINQTKLEEFQAKLEIAEQQFGETEISDCLLMKAEYLASIGDKLAAVEAFRVAFEKAAGVGGKLDIVFGQLRVGLFYLDHEIIQRYLEKAKSYDIH